MHEPHAGAWQLHWTQWLIGKYASAAAAGRGVYYSKAPAPHGHGAFAEISELHWGVGFIKITRALHGSEGRTCAAEGDPPCHRPGCHGAAGRRLGSGPHNCDGKLRHSSHDAPLTIILSIEILASFRYAVNDHSIFRNIFVYAEVCAHTQ